MVSVKVGSGKWEIGSIWCVRGLKNQLWFSPSKGPRVYLFNSDFSLPPDASGSDFWCGVLGAVYQFPTSLLLLMPRDPTLSKVAIRESPD